MPQLTQNNAKSAVDCLRRTNPDRRFSSSILMILIEDCRESRTERVNNNKNIIELVIGDIVMTQTAVQSDPSTNKIS